MCIKNSHFTCDCKFNFLPFSRGIGFAESSDRHRDAIPVVVQHFDIIRRVHGRWFAVYIIKFLAIPSQPTDERNKGLKSKLRFAISSLQATWYEGVRFHDRASVDYDKKPKIVSLLFSFYVGRGDCFSRARLKQKGRP
mgnify:CR=1 FL=1